MSREQMPHQDWYDCYVGEARRRTDKEAQRTKQSGCAKRNSEPSGSTWTRRGAGKKKHGQGAEHEAEQLRNAHEGA